MNSITNSQEETRTAPSQEGANANYNSNFVIKRKSVFLDNHNIVENKLIRMALSDKSAHDFSSSDSLYMNALDFQEDSDSGCMTQFNLYDQPVME